MKYLVRLTPLATTLLLVLIGIVLLVESCAREDGIHVAIVSSQTGDLAEIGKDMSRGAMMRLDEINSEGGIRNRKINYHIYDDQSEKNPAVSVANLVAQDSRIIAIIGHLASRTMSAAAPVYARAGIPVIMPVPTNPEITSHGYNNLFRIPPTDNDQGPFLADYVFERNPTAKVAVVNDLTDYGVGIAEAFRKRYEEREGDIVAYEGVQRSARDFRTLITKLKGLNPEYVFLGATYDMGAPFVRQMSELGFSATVLAGDGCYGTEFTRLARDAAEGSIVSFIAPDRSSSTKTEEFYEKFEEEYGKVVSFAPLGYDAASVVVEALRETTTFDRAQITRTLHSSEFIVDGVIGQIRFAANGDNINKNLTLYTVQQGEWVLLRD